MTGGLAGRAIPLTAIGLDELHRHSGAIDDMFDAKLGALIVREAFPRKTMKDVAERLRADDVADKWSFPNAGMTGGEIRVIGEAATPTFTTPSGPTLDAYRDGAARYEDRVHALFAPGFDPIHHLAGVLERLGAGRPMIVPRLPEDTPWAPCNFRALDPDQQIYAHHDNHYGLGIYDHFGPDLDRTTLLSWFVTVQEPESGGKLIVYGVQGSDPDLPMLPTRFVDAEALDRGYRRRILDLGAGDLVVFDSGRHVHRVTPVDGSLPRLTFGGFIALDLARRRLACWS